MAPGTGFSACAGPRGYAKVQSSNGTGWAKTMAWGGSSSGFGAYAGQNGLFGKAAPDGHAVAMYGSGSKFTVAMYESGGQVFNRHWDGSTSRGKVSDEKRGRIRHGNKDERVNKSSDGYWRFSDGDWRSGDGNWVATRFGY